MFWNVRGRRVATDVPLVMGILNVTPDSFSDGGRYVTVGAAQARAAQMIAEGADIIDVGGESTRPGVAERVSEDEELGRIIPVITALAADEHTIISVDTVRSTVARAALDAGAHIVNDVSATRLDGTIARLCAERGAGLVLMHSRGEVEDMATYAHATYDGDVLDEVLAELRERVDACLSRGVQREQIVVDPGVGFGKRSEHSLRLLACIGRLRAWGFPVMIGASRKRFVGEVTRVPQPMERVFGSVGAAVSAFDRGARIFRVHDVAATRQALDVAAAIAGAGDA